MVTQDFSPDTKDLAALFRKAADGDVDSKLRLESWLKTSSIQVALGHHHMSQIKELTYLVVADQVNLRWNDYPDLKGRHDLGSVESEAYIRLRPFLDAIEKGEDKSKEYIGWTIKLTEYVLLDMVERVRKSDGRLGAKEDPSLLSGRPLTDTAETKEQHAKVRAAITQLPPEERLIIRLKYHNQWNELKIAELLDLTTHQVGFRATRAQERLKELLKDC